MAEGVLKRRARCEHKQPERSGGKVVVVLWANGRRDDGTPDTLMRLQASPPLASAQLRARGQGPSNACA